MVRRCAVWFIKAGGEWPGKARSGLLWQVGFGADRCVLVGCGELRQARLGLGRSGAV